MIVGLRAPEEFARDGVERIYAARRVAVENCVA
jgi:hypothetical protein